MPGRNRVPSFQLASGTTDERDNSYNISNTLGSIFYNTDTSNVEIRHEDPSNNVGWRDLVMNNKEQIDISGKLVVNGDVSFNAHLSAVDASFQNNVDISGGVICSGGFKSATIGGTTTSATVSEQIVFRGSGPYPRIAIGGIGDATDGVFIGRNNADGHGFMRLQNGGDPATGIFLQGGGDSYIMGGNVGIGTTAPDAPLDVVGNINCSGDISGRYFVGSYVNISHSIGTRTNDSTFYSSDDNYIRKNSASGMRSSLGLANSATIEATTADTANKIAMRNVQGDIFARLFRSDYPNQTDCGPAIAFRNTTTDNYIRFCSNMGNVRSRIGAYGNGSNITRSAHNNGFLVGSYNNVGANSNESNPIYTIGSSYTPYERSLSNMYGIGYTHGNFNFNNNILKDNGNRGWGLYVAADGDARIGLNATHGLVKAYSFGIVPPGGYNDKLRIKLYVDNIGFFGDSGLNGYIEDDRVAYNLNFTGQHRTFIKDVSHKDALFHEGLIVCADQNKYVKMNGGVEIGKNAITTNESLPIVTISNKIRDKSCFGVVSSSEDPELRSDKYGKFVSAFQKEDGDTRIFINSVGEGAIWVSNKNGDLESGDYITTSDLTGYGMKQDSDSLKNYTVAKITMDCDFNPQIQKVKKIKKTLQNITYWVNRDVVDVSDEKEYDTLPEDRRIIVDVKSYSKDNEEITVEKYLKLSLEKQKGYVEKITKVKKRINIYKEKTKPEDITGYKMEICEELTNTLDENGEFEWEETDKTERAYKVRYLLPDSTQISEEEYNTRLLAKEEVYISAFVGCTYHCG